MNSKTILSSDLLDILFEKRNKNYGAYILRKFYPHRVKTSLFIMLCMAAIFSAFTFLPEKKSSNPYTLAGEDSILIKTYDEARLKEKPKNSIAETPKVSTQKLLSKMKIVDNTEKTDSLHDVTNLQIGSVTAIIDELPVSEGIPLEIVSSVPAPPVPAAPATNINEPIDNPDMQASFPGGDKELVKFLERNLLSPEEMEEGADVQVKIKFVVGFDGNLQGFEVLKDGGNSFNEEVIRVLKKMPRWNPGKKGGRSVPVYHILPVKFAAN